MEEIDYSRLVCPTLRFKRVSYFGIFKYLSVEGLLSIVRNSNGEVSTSMDAPIDYVVLSSDTYFRYCRRLFKAHRDVLHLYEYVNRCRNAYRDVKVVSEEQLLADCNVSVLQNVFPHYLGRQTFRPLSSYVVMDMVSTGLDYHLDDVVQISALKVLDDAVVDSFEVDVVPSDVKHDYVVSVVRSYTKNPIIRYSLEEALIRYVRFVGDLPILSYDAMLRNNFIFYCYHRVTLECLSNDYVDLFQLVGNLYPHTKKINFDSVSKKLRCDLDYTHASPLELCHGLHRAYQTVKKKLRSKDVSTFGFNYFRNRSFVLEGVFESVSRRYLCGVIEYLGGRVVSTLSTTVEYLVLSDVCYCDYANGTKTKRQITAENLMMNGARLSILSESTFKSLLYYHLTQESDDSSLLNLLTY